MPMSLEKDRPAAAAALPPHQVLAGHYASESDRRPYIDELFEAAAGHYDWINGLMSFGSGRRYRRRALLRAGVAPGMTVLDVGCGTGVVAELAAAIVGADGVVVALDPSPSMLAEAGKRRGITIPVRGIGERLPLADASIDRLIMGYALRHVADLRVAFAEYARVLKPGGRLLLLEITRPRSKLAYYPLKLYLKHTIPTLTGWLRRSRDAQILMSYYWDTIEYCVEPASILAALDEFGLTQVEHHAELGIFSEYTATKPVS